MDEIAGYTSAPRQRLVVVTFAAWISPRENHACITLSRAMIDIKALQHASNVAGIYIAHQGSLSSGSEYGPAMTLRRERASSRPAFGIGTVAVTVVP